jgi:hypothetical protein
MAQTRRRRTTKHRGNAAGVVTRRGRTGRPLSPAERKQQTREEARIKRLETAPTWRSAAIRGGIASAMVFLFLLLFGRGGSLAVAVIGALVSFLIYTPGGYYFELILWRRRMAKRRAGR